MYPEVYYYSETHLFLSVAENFPSVVVSQRCVRNVCSSLAQNVTNLQQGRNSSVVSGTEEMSGLDDKGIATHTEEIIVIATHTDEMSGNDDKGSI